MKLNLKAGNKCYKNYIFVTKRIGISTRKKFLTNFKFYHKKTNLKNTGTRLLIWLKNLTDQK